MTKDFQIQITVNAVHVRLPIYRVWLDDELMCERTFWPNPEHVFIQEQMHVALVPGVQNKLRFESVDPTLGKVWMERVQIIDSKRDQLVQDHGIGRMKNNEQELFFTI